MEKISQGEEITGANLPILYTDKNGIVFEKVFLSDQTYAEAIQTMVVVCTDIILVNKKEKSVFLAKRKARPASNKWWMFGGRVFAGEEPVNSAQRCFMRETGIRIELERFIFVCMNRYFFRDRQQFPQTVPADSLTYTFLVDISDNDVNSISLDAHEYYGEIKKFTSLQEIQNENIDKPIIDIYLKIFAD